MWWVSTARTCAELTLRHGAVRPRRRLVIELLQNLQGAALPLPLIASAANAASGVRSGAWASKRVLAGKQR